MVCVVGENRKLPQKSRSVYPVTQSIILIRLIVCALSPLALLMHLWSLLSSLLFSGKGRVYFAVKGKSDGQGALKRYNECVLASRLLWGVFVLETHFVAQVGFFKIFVPFPHQGRFVWKGYRWFDIAFRKLLTCLTNSGTCTCSLANRHYSDSVSKFNKISRGMEGF